MPIERNGKTYYTQEEVDTHIHAHIRKTGEEMLKELRKKRAQQETKDSKIAYV